MPTTQRSSSEKTYGEPSSLPDEMTAVGVSTSGITAAATIATTEKGGIGAVTVMMTSEASHLATVFTR